jgi:hypothetical protein
VRGHRHRLGAQQVSEGLLQGGKAKLKAGGESYLWHGAMAVEKESGTLSPYQFHHRLGHGKEPGAMKGVREHFGELTTGDGVGTGADYRTCNGGLIQGVQDQRRGIIDMNPGEPLVSWTKRAAKTTAIQRKQTS